MRAFLRPTRSERSGLTLIRDELFQCQHTCALKCLCAWHSMTGYTRIWSSLIHSDRSIYHRANYPASSALLRMNKNA